MIRDSPIRELLFHLKVIHSYSRLRNHRLEDFQCLHMSCKLPEILHILLLYQKTFSHTDRQITSETRFCLCRAFISVTFRASYLIKMYNYKIKIFDILRY